MGLILLPILMMLEYSLRILAIRLYLRGYGKHFSFKINDGDISYEEAGRLKLISAQQIIKALFYTFLIRSCAISMPKAFDTLYLFIIGIFIIPIAIRVGIHIYNMLVYFYAIRNPKEIEGETVISALNTTKHSQYNLYPYIFMFSLTYAFSYSDFILGGLFGTLYLSIYYQLTRKRNRKIRN
jgi:hypothetical protein